MYRMHESRIGCKQLLEWSDAVGVFSFCLEFLKSFIEKFTTKFLDILCGSDLIKISYHVQNVLQGGDR